jgi:hypothetical protein
MGLEVWEVIEGSQCIPHLSHQEFRSRIFRDDDIFAIRRIRHLDPTETLHLKPLAGFLRRGCLSLRLLWD